MKSEVFAIYFPSWHIDRHYEKWYGKGFSEWELVKSTHPLFKEHVQPKKPLRGYFDESALEKQSPAVIINAWNKWTEGMMLLPDEQYHDGFLKAIKEVCQ